jgi:fatty acid desaturase
MNEMSISKEQYTQMRSELNTDPSFAPTFAILLFDIGLLTAAVALIRSGNTLAFAGSQVLLAVVFFNSFSILHECGHGSASRHAWINTLVGHYASTFCFIPFYPWKYIHQKHHAWTGNLERDPVLKSLRTWRRTGVPQLVRLCWSSWIPLGALLQHVVYATYPIVMWREGAMTRTKALRTLASLLWLPLGYAALHHLFPDVVRFGSVAPAFFLFLVAEELVNIPHHVGMATYEDKLPIWHQYRATRSCYYPRGVSELLVLNFNFHIEHHLFPNLPWYRLRGARDVIRARLAGQYQEAVGIGWNVAHRSIDLQAIVDRHGQQDRHRQPDPQST